MTLTVYIPDDAAALSVGADDVVAALQTAAVSKNIDLTVIRNGSRGMLWAEPLVEQVTDKGRMAFGPVSPEDADALLDAMVNDSDHPLSLGPTDEIPYFKDQERLTFARVGLIDPLNLGDFEANGGLAGLKAALALDPADICGIVTESGLRGRGGAGFPAGIKWKTVHDQDVDQKYICCNADEGDSGTFADRMLMEGDPFSLIEGMIIAGLATKATQGIVYIRSEYPHAIAKMQRAIDVMEEAGWLGDNINGSGKAFSLKLRKGAGAYICGEESSMLNSIEGKRGTVRSKPPIPAIQGLFGKPTIVNNVLTLATAPIILARGADFYKNYGMGRSTGTQAFQLAGNIKRGGLVEKAFGVTIRELIEGYGEGTASGRPFRTAQLGGPLGAYVSDDMLDLPMDYETLAQNKAMLGHGGITVFDETVDMAEMARFAFEFCQIESCGKCTPCRIGAVRGRETVEKVLRGEDVARNIALIEDLCEVMTDGSLCAMGGLTPMPVLSALRLFPQDFDRAPALAAE
ncbi:formate dehydrogenase beta subunit [Aestuariispira ectoiniformans]|uniref:formate dehydrogenase beta subunit n=1 Tax=Aestuariispira ectoiniformans TaxID=2775080 RepID=UPI00223AFF9C|nr:formate dehydrogenase beta subunit [Aestuariispira ectoiniformans]